MLINDYGSLMSTVYDCKHITTLNLIVIENAILFILHWSMQLYLNLIEKSNDEPKFYPSNQNIFVEIIESACTCAVMLYHISILFKLA